MEERILERSSTENEDKATDLKHTWNRPKVRSLAPSDTLAGGSVKADGTSQS